MHNLVYGIILLVLVSSCKNKTDSSYLKVEAASNSIELNIEKKLENDIGIKQYDKGSIRKHNYDGTYKLLGKNECGLVVSMSGSNYTVKTRTKSISGAIEVVKEDNEIYLLFKNWLGDDPEIDIEGRYENQAIHIQNYGNEMNSYTRISECGNKYLQLKKNIHIP